MSVSDPFFRMQERQTNDHGVIIKKIKCWWLRKVGRERERERERETLNFKDNMINFFFFREFQLMAPVLDNSSLSSDQDTN